MTGLVLPLVLVSAFLVAKPIPNRECLDCHVDVSLTNSRANSHRSHSCVHCHEAVKVIPHEEKLPPVRCGNCHRREAEDFSRSVHGDRSGVKREHLPGCTTCHGKAHDIISHRNARAPLARNHLAETCGKCHPKPMLDRVFAQFTHRRTKMDIQPGQLK